MNTRRSSSRPGSPPRFPLGIAFLAAAVIAGLVSCAAPDDGSSGDRDVPALDRAVYIVNSLAETISVLDPGTGTLYDDVITVGKYPNAVVPWDGKLFVVDSGDNDVRVYRESDYEKLETIDLGSNRNPWTIIIDTDRNRGFVPNFMAGTVTAIDLDTYKILAEIDLDTASSASTGPEGGCYMDGRVFVGNTAYDSGENRFGEGKVSVIDSESCTLAATISVEPDGWTSAEQGSNPQSIVPFPSLGEVHAICTGVNGGSGSDDGAVVSISVPAYSSGVLPSVASRLELGGSPVASIDSSDSSGGRTYLAGVGGIMTYLHSSLTAEHPSSGYLYDAGAASFVSGVCWDPADGVLIATDFGTDRILIIDPSSGTVTKTLAASDGPQTPALFTSD